jgi:hypothetical protein
VFVLGVEKGLLAGELLEKVLRLLLGRGLGFVLGLIGRIELVQPELFARFDAELLAIVQGCEPPAAAPKRGPDSIVIVK